VFKCINVFAVYYFFRKPVPCIRLAKVSATQQVGLDLVCALGDGDLAVLVLRFGAARTRRCPSGGRSTSRHAATAPEMAVLLIKMSQQL